MEQPIDRTVDGLFHLSASNYGKMTSSNQVTMSAHALVRIDPSLRKNEEGDCWPTIAVDYLRSIYSPVPSEILDEINVATPLGYDIDNDESMQMTMVLFLSDRYVIKLAIEEEAACLRNELLVAYELSKLLKDEKDRRFVRYLHYSSHHTTSLFPYYPNAVDVAVMEYVEGESLHLHLSSCSVIDAKRVLREIFEILHDAHVQIGFTHYDLHPKNVIVGLDGHPTLIDYGYSYCRNLPSSGVKLALGAIDRETNWSHDVIKLLGATWQLRSKLRYVKEKEDLIRKFCMEELIVRLVNNNLDYKIIKELRERYANTLSSGDLDEQAILLERARSLLIKQTEHLSWLPIQEDEFCRAIEPLISYFPLINDDNTLIRLPEEIIWRLKSLTQYIAVFQSELSNASLDEWMKLVEECL